MSKKSLKEENKDIPQHPGKKIAIAVAQWHKDITDRLLEACKSILIKAGIESDDMLIVEAPGTFELPISATYADQKLKADAVICLGCVIKGETDHDEYINQSVAQTLQLLSIERQKPYVFGVVTVLNKEQALQRAGGKNGNKGEDAAMAALQLIALKERLFHQKHGIGFNKP